MRVLRTNVLTILLLTLACAFISCILQVIEAQNKTVEPEAKNGTIISTIEYENETENEVSLATNKRQFIPGESVEIS